MGDLGSQLGVLLGKHHLQKGFEAYQTLVVSVEVADQYLASPEAGGDSTLSKKFVDHARGKPFVMIPCESAESHVRLEVLVLAKELAFHLDQPLTRTDIDYEATKPLLAAFLICHSVFD